MVGGDMSRQEQPEPELVLVDATPTVVVAGVVEEGEIRDHFDRSFALLAAVMGEQGLAPTGPAFALYRRPPGATLDLEVGFTIDGDVDPTSEVRSGSLPAGRAARVIHRGSFDHLAESWERLRTWIDGHGLTPIGPLWETYLTEPTPDADPDDMRTELSWLVD